MPQLLKYLILDDDEIDRLAIEAEASSFSFLHKIASCHQPLEAFELVTRFHPDIIFADIEMPGMNGLELMCRLSGQVAATVFVTSHPEFAMAGYETAAFDYLLKPLDAARFARCVFRLRDFCRLRSKAFAFDKEQETDCMIVRQGYEKYKVYISAILYLEAMKDYTRIVTASGQYLVLSTFSNMQEKLPPEKFVRIHRSYIVNRDQITAIKGQKIQFPSQELPVGKSYKHALNGLLL